MEWLLLVIGIAIVLFAALDALWTALWVDGGAGPLSRRLLAVVQRVVGRFRRRQHHRMLSLAGPSSMLLMLMAWVGLTWLGWSLVFLADTTALQVSEGRPIDIFSIIYFTGYTLFTLGMGDIIPMTPAAQLATAFASLNGLLIVTLGLTYLVTVLSAVVQQRSLASTILGLAKRPQDLVITAWNRNSLEGLESLFQQATQTLTETTEQHFAYPVLHAFHAEHPQKSISIALAVLDDALSLVRYGVRAEYRPRSLSMSAARAAVESYLETLRHHHFEEAESAPPPPPLQPLRDAGIPVVSDEEFAAAMAGLRERRRLLCGNLQTDLWTWDQVTDPRR